MKEVANTPKKQNERRSLRKSARQVNMRKTLLLIFKAQRALTNHTKIIRCNVYYNKVLLWNSQFFSFSCQEDKYQGDAEDEDDQEAEERVGQWRGESFWGRQPWWQSTQSDQEQPIQVAGQTSKIKRFFKRHFFISDRHQATLGQERWGQKTLIYKENATLLFISLFKTVWQDYVNWIVKDLNQPELADYDNSDRKTTPRFVHISIQGGSTLDQSQVFFCIQTLFSQTVRS